MATAFARPWHVRSKTRCAAWRGQSLVRRRGELAASRKVPSAQEAAHPRAFGRRGNCAASTRRDNRRFCPHFEENDRISINHFGKKHSGVAFRKPERRQNESLLY